MNLNSFLLCFHQLNLIHVLCRQSYSPRKKEGCLAISLHCLLTLVLHSPSICITVCNSSLTFHNLVCSHNCLPLWNRCFCSSFPPPPPPPKMFLSSLKPAKRKFYFCPHTVCSCCIKLQYFKAYKIHDTDIYNT